jgi:hypothetical protein
MFIRIAQQRQGKREYRSLQIAESYRDPNKGGTPRTRILAHPGTMKNLGEKQIEKLIAGLQRALGRKPSEETRSPCSRLSNISAGSRQGNCGSVA